VFVELAELLLRVVSDFGAWGVVALLLFSAFALFARGLIHWAAACNLRISFLESEIADLRVDRAYWRTEARTERELTHRTVGVAEAAAQ
jgi:hypothetical protein